jgi:energy-coupling factor transporter transmembrane protein EcfT
MNVMGVLAAPGLAIAVSPADIALGVIAFFFVIIVVILAILAARRFAGGIGRGMLVIALGVVVMGLDFLEAIDVERMISIGDISHLLPAWYEEATIVLALVLFTLGFLIIYRTAVKVASREI